MNRIFIGYLIFYIPQIIKNLPFSCIVLLAHTLMLAHRALGKASSRQDNLPPPPPQLQPFFQVLALPLVVCLHWENYNFKQFVVLMKQADKTHKNG